MKEFVIVTDTTTDLPRDYVEKHHLYMMSLPYTLEGTSYTWEKPMPVKDFYDKMRAGSLPTTSQANPEEAALLYESILKDNDVDILHIVSVEVSTAAVSRQQMSVKNIRITGSLLLIRLPQP